MRNHRNRNHGSGRPAPLVWAQLHRACTPRALPNGISDFSFGSCQLLGALVGFFLLAPLLMAASSA